MKPSGLSSLVCLLLCVATVLISCTFFLLVSASQHHNLHSFSYDLMEKMNSSSVFVFLILNLIIAAILIESPSACLAFLAGVKEAKVEEKDIHGDVEDGASSDVDRENHNHGEDGHKEEDENGNKLEEDSDLERRIEEFIAKVNRRWREELLMEKLIMAMEYQPS